VIQRQTILNLPLMDHLVQYRVLNFAPGMMAKVSPADGDLPRLTGTEVDRELTQPGFHPSGKPEPNLPKPIIKKLGIEPLVGPGQLMEHPNVSWTGMFAPATSWGPGMEIYRE
jgi:hypothetical protein